MSLPPGVTNFGGFKALDGQHYLASVAEAAVLNARVLSAGVEPAEGSEPEPARRPARTGRTRGQKGGETMMFAAEEADGARD